jgi:hypothetical protein
VIRDALDGAEDRVDGDDADDHLGRLVALGGNVAGAATDSEHHLDGPAVGERGDEVVRIEDLQLGRDIDVGRHDLAGLVFVEPHLDLVKLAVQAADELLEVEDDVGDVFLDALDGGELVGDTFDLHRTHGSTLERREQHTTQSVAERMPEPAIEGFYLEARPVAGKLLARDVGHLKL